MALLPANANAQTWWSPSYAYRAQVTVTTSADLPDKGYEGYTARFTGLDTAALVASGKLQSDCDDLRLVYWDGAANIERPRHLLDCNTTASDMRFALTAAQAANTSDSNYYLYYGNSAAGSAPAVTPTNVYLWYDDASSNRLADYTHGRIDQWHGNSWYDGFTWNSAGYYVFDTNDNFTGGLRRPVDERDVYVEMEWYHTGCYPLNMTSGLVTRGIINSGAAGTEESIHYYATNRGQNDFGGCTAGGYPNDGDIIKEQRTNVAVDGPDPASISQNQWRKSALSAYGINGTQLTFHDIDNSAAGPVLGFPDAVSPHVTGTDANDYEGRGFAGVIIAQDTGRFRNMIIRRYVPNVPAITLGAEEPIDIDVNVEQTVAIISDTFGSDYALPMSKARYTLTVSNAGSGEVDSGSIILTVALDANTRLIVDDISGPGSGPLLFTDAPGGTASGVTYTFTSLGDLSDDASFSPDGTNYDYIPVAAGDGTDSAVTHIRITPGGTMAGTTSGGIPDFSFNYDVITD